MVFTEAERKERKRISQKKYSDNNREKVLESKKKYRDNNREKIAEYYQANKEKVAEYYEENREKILERHKKYNIENHKTNIISQWRHQGIIDSDYELLYEVFIKETNCWICGKEFNNDIVMDRRCLDHDHEITDDENVRYILCNYCNLHVVC